MENTNQSMSSQLDDYLEILLTDSKNNQTYEKDNEIIDDTDDDISDYSMQEEDNNFSSSYMY
jgi:hypothetical protein